MSQTGFGAAPLGGEYGSIDEEECSRSVRTALDGGINFFDTAAYYGRGLSELRLGAALKGCRHQAIISTKCSRYGVSEFDFSADSARKSIEASLTRLGTDYVDILHVHDVEFGSIDQITGETLPALREIQQSGKARFIGVTGLALKMLHRIASETPVDCVLSYCRYNLLNQDLDSVLEPYAREHHIGLISASPLHMGVLSEAGPPPWHPAPEPVKAAGRQIVELCQSRNVSVATLALQFALRHPSVATTLVGMSTVEQVESNLLASEATYEADLLARIAEIAEPVRHTMWITGNSENH